MFEVKIKMRLYAQTTIEFIKCALSYTGEYVIHKYVDNPIPHEDLIIRKPCL